MKETVSKCFVELRVGRCGFVSSLQSISKPPLYNLPLSDTNDMGQPNIRLPR